MPRGCRGGAALLLVTPDETLRYVAVVLHRRAQGHFCPLEELFKGTQLVGTVVELVEIEERAAP